MSALLDRINTLDGSIVSTISEEEENNIRANKYRDELIEAEMLFGQLFERLDIYTKLEKEIGLLTLNYKDKRKRYLEEFVSTIINYVFDENYETILDIKQHGNTTRASVKLKYVDNNGSIKELDPGLQNGGLLQQVTGLSLGIAVNLLLGNNLIILDEALNGGDSVKVRKVQVLLERFTSKGNNQIIMNEHNENAYRDIDCVIAKLEKIGTGLTGKVYVKEQIYQKQIINLSDIEQDMYE